MSTTVVQHIVHNTTELNRDGIRGIIREQLRPFVTLGILLLAAGTASWTIAWIFGAVFWCSQAAYVLLLLRSNPQLLNYRAKMQKNTRGFDKVFFAVYLPLTILVLILAGFDAVRYQWSTMAFEWNIVGYLLYISAFSLALWAMLASPHFEGTVRVQEERSHQVCSSGPYKFVRHPGYTAMIVIMLSFPLLLDSWWAYIPASLAAVLIVWRTVLEDRMLRKELSGYKEFAQSTQYRLVPFLW